MLEKRLARKIIQGLLTILPLALTLYAFCWTGISLARLFATPLILALRPFVGNMTDLPGWFLPCLYVVSLVFGVIVLILVGIAVHYALAQTILAWIDRKVSRIPLAKTLYGSIKDLLGLFSGEAKAFSRVVLVPLPGIGHKVLGMVTREDFSAMKAVPPNTIAVYIPMSYQIGGFTVLVPNDSVETVDMSVEDALRFSVTAGVSSTKSGGAPAQV